MHLKTILNRVTDYKSFVFGKTAWREDAPAPTIEVEVKPRANGRPVCSGCGEAAARLRHHADAPAVRLHAVVGNCGRVRLLDASGRLPGRAA